VGGGKHGHPEGTKGFFQPRSGPSRASQHMGRPGDFRQGDGGNGVGRRFPTKKNASFKHVSPSFFGASHLLGHVGLLQAPPSYVSTRVKLIRGNRREVSTSNILGEIRGKQGPGFDLSLPCLWGSPLRVARRRVGGGGRQGPPCRCLSRHHNQGLQLPGH